MKKWFLSALPLLVDAFRIEGFQDDQSNLAQGYEWWSFAFVGYYDALESRYKMKYEHYMKLLSSNPVTVYRDNPQATFCIKLTDILF